MGAQQQQRMLQWQGEAAAERPLFVTTWRRARQLPKCTAAVDSNGRCSCESDAVGVQHTPGAVAQHFVLKRTRLCWRTRLQLKFWTSEGCWRHRCCTIAPNSEVEERQGACAA